MPNLVYINAESILDWTDSGGTDTMDLGGLTNDSVREGARHDFGDVSRSEWYEWRMVVDGFTTAPVVGETVDVYLSTSDGTFPDGDIGTTDQAGATVDLPNMKFLGHCVVQTVTAGDELIASGIVRIVARYVSPVIHNNTADILASSGDAHHFFLTPVPPEIQ